MRVLVSAAVAAAISTAAMAKDIKATVMTDFEMDKVTAGDGFGVYTAFILHDASGLPNGIAPGISTAAGAGGLGGGHPPAGFLGNFTAGK